MNFIETNNIQIKRAANKMFKLNKKYAKVEKFSNPNNMPRNHVDVLTQIHLSIYTVAFKTLLATKSKRTLCKYVFLFPFVFFLFLFLYSFVTKSAKFNNTKANLTLHVKSKFIPELILMQ